MNPMPQLAPQEYGFNMAQGKVGGPCPGIWLECACGRNDRIVGSDSKEAAKWSDAYAACVFRFHGWTGEGDRMRGQKCPDCAKAVAA